MLSALILATAITGQAQPGYSNAEPARQWVQGMVDGKPVWLWGWKDPQSGYVWHYRHENPQVFGKPAAKPAPKPGPKPIVDGLVLESNGTINAGLDLHATRPTGVLETNDPDLAKKLENCPNDEPDPDIPALPAGDQPNTDWLLPVSIVVAVLAVVYAFAKDD